MAPLYTCPYQKLRTCCGRLQLPGKADRVRRGMIALLAADDQEVRGKSILDKRCREWAIGAQKTGLRTVRLKSGQMVRETVDQTRSSGSRADGQRPNFRHTAKAESRGPSLSTRSPARKRRHGKLLLDGQARDSGSASRAEATRPTHCLTSSKCSTTSSGDTRPSARSVRPSLNAGESLW